MEESRLLRLFESTSYEVIEVKRDGRGVKVEVLRVSINVLYNQ